MAIESQALRVHSESPDAASVARTGKRVHGKDRMFVVERLALLLDTGTALHEGLTLLRQQNPSKAMRPVLEALERDVGTGMSFSEALRAQAGAFPESYATLVEASERGGFLPQVLDRLHQMEEAREELRSTLWSALSYPAFLMVFSVAVVVFVLVFVFPKFADLFVTIADHLPMTTVLLLKASDVLRNWWWAVIGGAVGGAALLWQWFRHGGRESLDRWSYQLPVLRNFVAELHLIQFLQVVSLSLAHGVALVDALRAARATLSSRRFRDFVGELDRHVVEGRSLAFGFRDFSPLPALAGQMVATGEMTGNLAKVLARVADYYERQWRKRLQTATKLVEPIMLLVMGGVIGLVVSSLLLPIFRLSRIAG